MKIRSYDTFGSIALVKFPEDFKKSEKKKFALKLLKEQKSIKTVLEKSGKIKGRLRKFTTKYIAGEKTKEVLYHENGCVFRFNIDSTYFSPRLSNERKEIASKIKKDDVVLVMFAGVAPFSIILAKHSHAKKVVSVEINKEASKYAKLNVELNKLKDKVEVIQADVKKLPNKIKEKFDVIVMARPQLKETFLKQAFYFSKKGTRVYYYDFCKQDKINLIINKIKDEAKKYKKKIKIIHIKEAGEIAPYKIRLRVDFIVD
jgi:tRNA (guanine37-N1)-methyltransferase